MVLDSFIKRSVTGGLGSGQAEIMADTAVALASANVASVAKKVISRLCRVSMGGRGKGKEEGRGEGEGRKEGKENGREGKEEGRKEGKRKREEEEEGRRKGRGREGRRGRGREGRGRRGNY